MRIVFMGSDTFSLQILTDMHQNPSIDLCGIVTIPPKKQGRGYYEQATCVATYGVQHAIPTLAPATLKDASAIEALAHMAPDVIVVASYGILLPSPVLALPRLGCVNVHPSLLPRWRGASPVPFTLLEGDPKTGLSFFVMDAGMDTGALLAQWTCDTPPNTDAGSLLAFLGRQAALPLVETLFLYAKGTLTPIPQATEGVTYTRKLTKEDGLLAFNTEDAHALVRRVLAMNPKPGAYFFWEGKRIHVLSAIVAEKGFACIDKNCFWPTQVKPEGKNSMPFEAFLHGQPALRAKLL